MTNAIGPSLRTEARTWRKRFRSLWVRIGIVLLLIMAVSLFSVWWPRRTSWAVLWVYGTVHDDGMSHGIDMTYRRLPSAIRPVWRAFFYWFGRERLYWDTGLSLINLVETRVDDRWLARLRNCKNLVILSLHHRQMGPGLEALKELPRLGEVTIASVTHETPLGHLAELPHIGELIIDFADDAPSQPLSGWQAVADRQIYVSFYMKGPDLARRLQHVPKSGCNSLFVDGSIDDDTLRSIGSLSSLKNMCLKDPDNFRNTTLDGWKELRRLKRLDFVLLKHWDDIPPNDLLGATVRTALPNIRVDIDDESQ